MFHKGMDRMTAASCVKGYDIVKRQKAKPERDSDVRLNIIEEHVLGETKSCCETSISIFQKQYS